MTDVERKTPAPNGSEYVLKTNLVLRESTSLIAGTSRTTAGKRTGATRN
jgi:hypothetical protein